MKALLLVATLLTGCAAAPQQPEPETQASAAVGSASFWRWVGRAVITLLGNTEVKVNIDTKEKND